MTHSGHTAEGLHKGGRGEGSARRRPATSPATRRAALYFLLLSLACASLVRGQVTGVDNKPPKKPAPVVRRPQAPRAGATPVRGPRSTRPAVAPVRPTPQPTPTETAGSEGEPSWVVSYSPGDSCGAVATLNVYPDGPRPGLGRVLVLKCVQDFRQKAGSEADDFPQFIYTNQPPGERLYVAVFKYDGAVYREEDCRTADASDPDKLVPVACDGRGVVAPPGTER